MRIIHLSYSADWRHKDPEAWLKYLSFFTGILEVMARHGEIININFIDYTGTVKKVGVTHYFFKKNKLQRLFPLSFHSFVRLLQPDVVFIHGLIYPWQVLLLRSQLGKHVKIVAQNHAEKPLKGLKKYLQLLADKYIGAYFFTSTDMAMPWVGQRQIRDLNKVHEVMEVSSVFSPVDRTEARKRTSVKGSKIYLWVGRLDKNKDPLTLVNAFISFLENGNDATLYVVFQTNELLPELQSLLKSHPQYAHQIVLIGKVQRDDLLYWYNSSDFIISTSHYEGSGVAVCEAMSCGCIPLLTDILSFRMMTGNKNCGLLFKAGDAKDLANALQKSVQLDVHREREKVFKQFQDKLSFEAIAKKFYEVCSAL